MDLFNSPHPPANLGCRRMEGLGGHEPHISDVGFGAAKGGATWSHMVWGSEVNFANNGIRRSEMWGSWLSSPTILVAAV